MICHHDISDGGPQAPADVLPSVELKMIDAQVFWPKPTSSLHALIEHSDHRLTWIDVKVK